MKRRGRPGVWVCRRACPPAAYRTQWRPTRQSLVPCLSLRLHLAPHPRPIRIPLAVPFKSVGFSHSHLRLASRLGQIRIPLFGPFGRAGLSVPCLPTAAWVSPAPDVRMSRPWNRSEGVMADALSQCSPLAGPSLVNFICFFSAERV